MMNHRTAFVFFAFSLVASISGASSHAVARVSINGSFSAQLGERTLSVYPDAIDCRYWTYQIAELQSDGAFGPTAVRLRPSVNGTNMTAISDYRWTVRLAPLTDPERSALSEQIAAHMDLDFTQGGDDFKNCVGLGGPATQAILLTSAKNRFDAFKLDARWTAPHRVGASIAVADFVGMQDQPWEPNQPAQLSFQLDAGNPLAEPETYTSFSSVPGKGPHLGSVAVRSEPLAQALRSSLTVDPDALEDADWRSFETLRCRFKPVDGKDPSLAPNLAALAILLIGGPLDSVTCEGLEDSALRGWFAEGSPAARFWASIPDSAKANDYRIGLDEKNETGLDLPVAQYLKVRALAKWLESEFGVLDPANEPAGSLPTSGTLRLRRQSPTLSAQGVSPMAPMARPHISWSEDLPDLALKVWIPLVFPGLQPSAGDLNVLNSDYLKCSRLRYDERAAKYPEAVAGDLPIPLSREICPRSLK